MANGAKQIKSRERVQEHGEVFTNEREVNAMLDLVKHETERIDSRFLEPACGDGNFLEAILKRKLVVCEQMVKKKKFSQMDYEKNVILAVSSIYGIDIMADNVSACRDRLLSIVTEQYKKLYKKRVKEDCIKSIEYLLSKNIIQGNALDFHRVDEPNEWIIVSEWSLIGGGMVNRRDYTFEYMVNNTVQKEGMFGYSDDPIRTFPPVHYLKLNNLSYGERV